MISENFEWTSMSQTNTTFSFENLLKEFVFYHQVDWKLVTLFEIAIIFILWIWSTIIKILAKLALKEKLGLFNINFMYNHSSIKNSYTSTHTHVKTLK